MGSSRAPDKPAGKLPVPHVGPLPPPPRPQTTSPLDPKVNVLPLAAPWPYRSLVLRASGLPFSRHLFLASHLLLPLTNKLNKTLYSLPAFLAWELAPRWTWHLPECASLLRGDRGPGDTHRPQGSQHATGILTLFLQGRSLCFYLTRVTFTREISTETAASSRCCDGPAPTTPSLVSPEEA